MGKGQLPNRLGNKEEKGSGYAYDICEGRHCGLPAGDELSPFVWDGGASQNLKLSAHTPGGFQENQDESLYFSEKLSLASNYQRLQGPAVLPQSSQNS